MELGIEQEPFEEGHRPEIVTYWSVRAPMSAKQRVGQAQTMQPAKVDLELETREREGLRCRQEGRRMHLIGMEVEQDEVA